MNVGGPAKNAIIEAEGSTDSSLAGGPEINKKTVEDGGSVWESNPPDAGSPTPHKL